MTGRAALPILARSSDSFSIFNAVYSSMQGGNMAYFSRTDKIKGQKAVLPVVTCVPKPANYQWCMWCTSVRSHSKPPENLRKHFKFYFPSKENLQSSWIQSPAFSPKDNLNLAVP
jgi:hypothetical protein